MRAGVRSETKYNSWNQVDPVDEHLVAFKIISIRVASFSTRFRGSFWGKTFASQCVVYTLKASPPGFSRVQKVSQRL